MPDARSWGFASKPFSCIRHRAAQTPEIVVVTPGAVKFRGSAVSDPADGQPYTAIVLF
jgi:hypothetical protein